jgi:hypothetical protein
MLAPGTARSSSVCVAFDDRRHPRELIVAAQHLLDLADHLDQARPDLALEPLARKPKGRRSTVECKRAGAVAERERNADGVHVRLPFADEMAKPRAAMSRRVRSMPALSFGHRSPLRAARRVKTS